MATEYKTFSGKTDVLSDSEGIVEAIVAVTGNIDLGNDLILHGAFKKSIQENTKRIKVLDNHRTDTVGRVLGIVLEMREVPKSKLPPETLTEYPEATGGLYTKTQYLLDTPEGMGAFKRIKSGAVSSYSIGYDPMDYSFEELDNKGKKIEVRILKQVRLWEYSPVIWGMNEGTSTLSVKNQDDESTDEPEAKENPAEPEPQEGKPWKVFEEDGKFVVYKVDADGKPVGKPLGRHDTRAEARAQIRALYANEKPKSLGNALSLAAYNAIASIANIGLANGEISIEEHKTIMSLGYDSSLIFVDEMSEELYNKTVDMVHALMTTSPSKPEPPEKVGEDLDQESKAEPGDDPLTSSTQNDEPEDLIERIKSLEAEIRQELQSIETFMFDERTGGHNA